MELLFHRVCEMADLMAWAVDAPYGFDELDRESAEVERASDEVHKAQHIGAFLLCKHTQTCARREKTRKSLMLKIWRSLKKLRNTFPIVYPMKRRLEQCLRSEPERDINTCLHARLCRISVLPGRDCEGAVTKINCCALHR
jgi:hypothetical protein